jgi:hypothetical protein
MGDRMSSASVVSPTPIKGTKNSARYPAGLGWSDAVLAITMRSNGTSKIHGAASAPMMALPSRARKLNPPRVRMMTKMAATALKVTGVTGSEAPVSLVKSLSRRYC